MKTIIQLSEKVYGVFLKFYPSSYKKQFGSEMKYVYSESIKDAYLQEGEPGIIKFWITSFFDGIKSLFMEHIENEEGGGSMKEKNALQNSIVRVGLVTFIILLIPVIGMQLSSEWDWKLFDFIIIGILISGFGFAVEYVKHKVRKKNERLALIFGLIFVALLVYVHLAVGIVDTWPLAGS